jgi:hypothetical protein
MKYQLFSVDLFILWLNPSCQNVRRLAQVCKNKLYIKESLLI